jgi:adenosylcobyric acid synthase
MRALMVQGTSSWAGKSLITTALCRHYARQGIRVAPFKAQNMSNNARVVAGGEIGVAQYLQALAARALPDPRMNPVLVKPEGPTQSQVVLDGAVDAEISALPWTERAPRLWPSIRRALRSLLDDYELVVLEGAGSPAEINLRHSDLTNSPSARAADARVLLVCDIDRGGAFAHLYGTWALTEPVDRARIAGFVLNKFRGDPTLLPPGPERLEHLTGVPTLGVVPWLEHDLPDEDGAALSRSGAGLPKVAVLRYPTASNLDELKLMEQVAAVRWAGRPADLDGADLVVLPGSKHVAADLDWLRSTGLDGAVRRHARAGGRVLGICGGLQMLGEELRDIAGVDGDAAGLGLLALRTTFEREKVVRPARPRFAPAIPGQWSALAGLGFDGYEIRHGRTISTDPAAVAVLPARCGWVDGPVLGVAVHGLLEAPEVLRALFGRAPRHSVEDAIEAITDGVMAGLSLPESNWSSRSPSSDGD